MTLKTLFLGLLLMLLLAFAWSQRDAALVQSFMRSDDAPAARIRFDNGSVRDLAAASEPASTAPADKPLSITGVRKCARGNVVVYTDKTCPPGSKQVVIANGTVNVVDDGGARERPAPARGKADPAREPEPTLRQQYMEAVINR